MIQRIRKAVIIIFVVLLLASFGVHTVLDNEYVNYPREPDQSTGRTVPYSVKNVVVYITKSQDELIFWLTRVKILSGILVVVSIILHRKWPINPK